MVKIKLTSGATIEVDSTEEAIKIAKALGGKAKRGRPKNAGKKTADMKAYRRAYYQANKEKIKESRAKWRKKNIDKVREYQRNWCFDNPDKVREYRKRRVTKLGKAKIRKSQREYARAWRAKNREHNRAYMREYMRAYKAKKRAEAGKVKPILTPEQKLEKRRAYGRAYYRKHKAEILKKAKAQRWLKNEGV